MIVFNVEDDLATGGDELTQTIVYAFSIPV